MLYLTERLYDVFCQRNRVITCLPTVENDYEDSSLKSYFERRLFYPDVEKELLDKYMALRIIPHSSQSFIEAVFLDHAKFHYYDDLFWDSAPKYFSEKEIFYDEPYGTSTRKSIDCKFHFSIGWNETDLIIKINIYNLDLNWGKEKQYSPLQDCIKFIFNDDWSSIFVLQIKKTGDHQMFIAKENIYPLEEVKSVTFYTRQNDEHSIITNIPWEYTGFIPKKGKKFFFYFNIICWDREMRCMNTIVFNDHENRLVKL